MSKPKGNGSPAGKLEFLFWDLNFLNTTVFLLNDILQIYNFSTVCIELSYIHKVELTWRGMDITTANLAVVPAY